MGYIHAVQLNDNSTHLIEPKLFATAGGTSTALTAGISNFELAAGVYINLKVSTVGANATLNVSGTGAKPIYYNGVAISANTLSEGNIYTLIYTGTQWEIVGDITGKNIMIGTTAEWNAHSTYIAPEGTLCIYTDASTYTDGEDNVIVVPGLKISNGINAIIDSPFIGEDIRKILDNHVRDGVRHITSDERTFWNNKINCEINNENLIFNRS